MAKKAAKKGKRMAVGGAAGVSDMMYREPGSKPANMPGQGRPSFMGGNPGRGRGRGIGGGRTNYPGIEGPGAGRGLGRPGTGMKPPSMGRPTTGGGLPPARGMGPARVDANTVSPGGGMGADTGLTPVGGGVMTPNMGRDPSAVSAPRTGGGTVASTGLTPIGGGTMTPNMNRDPSAVSAPRTGGGGAASTGLTPMGRGGAGAGAVGASMTPASAGFWTQEKADSAIGMKRGGLARKGKTMAKGGLVKGAGCAARGVKKPRYT